ncbi:NAD(P)-binding protein [Salinirussus salinus]|jgi:trk system potassium uptake protein TrkA|uniref:NAD(P)-binding protein n=1 Tax=Salinirussus salinus TaxID=1198300 RepID=UPI00135C40CB|nr:NAD(P)-binding protein [Salinirussus salinus]
MSVQNTRNAVIVGGGRVGRRTAAKITERGYTVTIVEADEKKAEALSVPPSSRVVIGDGADVEVFKEANPTIADVVAGLTNDTDTNLAVCELAREVVPEATTVLRINADGEQDYAYLNHVDNIVYPAAAGASVAATQITGGHVQ